MKKLLIGAAAIAMGLSLAFPAQAQVKLNLGGHFKGYGAYVSQDEPGNIGAPTGSVAGQTAGRDVRSVDILRETEIHFTGETTLDNGLTVGFHAEADIDNGTNGDSFVTEEAYAYFSGAWGRVNFGKEDGAAYLLQIAAPSADSNVDGIRQYIQPVNYDFIGNTGAHYAAFGAANVRLQDIISGVAANRVIVDVDRSGTASANDIRLTNASPNLTPFSFDYAHDVSGQENKITYLTPVFNGFQAGVSYTPSVNGQSRGPNGNTQKNRGLNEYGDVWDLAARYEGQFGELGIAVGGAWSHADHEGNNNTAFVFYRDVDNSGTFNAGDVGVGAITDRKAWNLGVDMNWGPFGIGAVYLNDDNGVSGNNLRTRTWVVGADYTTGPFKLGASYLNNEERFASAEVDTDRWTAGVTYTYGPGMTFRGSISYIDHDENLSFQGSSADATSILLGTQIDF